MKTVYARKTCIYSHRSLYRILIGTCIRPPQRSWFSQTIEGNFWRIEYQRVLALSTTQTTAFEKSWGSTFFNFASCYDVLILHTSFGNGHLICPWWCLRKSNLSAVVSRYSLEVHVRTQCRYPTLSTFYLLAAFCLKVSLQMYISMLGHFKYKELNTLRTLHKQYMFPTGIIHQF